MKATPTIGLFAAIFDQDGRILVEQRPEGMSFPGDWDLPGGGLEKENNAMALDERIVGLELAREVEEETGIVISIRPMPAMYPAVTRGGKDWAFVIPVKTSDTPTKGLSMFVSPDELKKLAENPAGNRLVSGWGKRMSRLALIGLTHSPNKEFAKQAETMLKEIQMKWPIV